MLVGGKRLGLGVTGANMGSIGSAAPYRLPPVLHCVFDTVRLPQRSKVGWPLMSVQPLADFTGFVSCISPQVEIFNAFPTEINQVNSLLASGVYLEDDPND